LQSGLPLIERKQALRRIVPKDASRLLYADHVDGAGVDLFNAACANDIEGIVAKHKRWPHRSNGKLSPWLKIKNPMYTQAEGRGEIFKPRVRSAAALTPQLDVAR
jgi:bifunctional non-homologous end joining protein LigD